MSNCDVHKRKPHKGGKMITFSDCYKSMFMPPCEKINRQRQAVKQSANKQQLCNKQDHCRAIVNNSTDENIENLKNGHVLQEIYNSESCKMYHKSSINNNHQFHDKPNATSKCCLNDQTYCTDNKHNSEKVSILKPSAADTIPCQNNITETAAQLNNSVLNHTDYKYCHCHTDAANSANIKISMPHTNCKYCHGNVDEDENITISKRSDPHTNCKYCDNNIKETRKTKVPLCHTDCKYCLSSFNNRIDVSPETSFGSNDSIYLADELVSLDSDEHIPCLVHDRDLMLDSLGLNKLDRQIYHKRAAPYTCRVCQYPEMYSINNRASQISESCTDPLLYSIQELSIQNNINQSTNFKPCEFCMTNGENPVIFNSHQFRNGFGTVTCPILRRRICHRYEMTGKYELRNYDETIGAINEIHPDSSIPHMELPLKGSNNACFSCPLPRLQSIPSVDLYSPLSSLETPWSYTFEPNKKIRENRGFHINLKEGNNYSMHHGIQHVTADNISAPNFNENDAANPFTKYSRRFASKLAQTGNFSNIRKPNKGVFCQFCLTTGKPPYIYNSHGLRDESGVNINCPILKEHANKKTAHNNCSRISHNIFDCETCFPLVKGISNGSLGKCQYFNLRDCLGR